MANAKRRRRNAPYFAVNSPAERSHNAQRECRMVRLGARTVACDNPYGARVLETLARVDTRPGRQIARALHGEGDNAAYRREVARRAELEREVPEANTSFGQHVEWSMSRGKRDEAVGRLLRVAMRAHCREAVEELSKGRVVAGIRALAKVVG